MTNQLKRLYNKFFRRKISVIAQIHYTNPSQRLKGRKIILTGGTGSIGLAMAKRFINEGAIVLITGRDKEKLESISKNIGCEASFLDLMNVESFDKFITEAKQKLGGIDCLVNNAGISLHESFESVTTDGFDRQIATNLRGPFFLSQKVIAYMSTNSIKGQILFISSETGETADIRPYGLSKAAINSLVQGLAYLYIEQDIRVNAIAPGVTTSNMTGYSNDNLYCSFNPNKRVYLPEEIAEIASFILSDISNSISGQIITCNNGKTINARWK